MDTIDLSKNDIHHVSHTRFFFFFPTTKKWNYSQWTCNLTIHRISSTIIVSDTCPTTIPLSFARRLCAHDATEPFFIPIVKPLSRFLVPLINYTKLDDACLCSRRRKKKPHSHTRSHQKYTFDMLTVYLFPRDLINPHFFFCRVYSLFFFSFFSFFFFFNTHSTTVHCPLYKIKTSRILFWWILFVIFLFGNYNRISLLLFHPLLLFFLFFFFFNWSVN